MQTEKLKFKIELCATWWLSPPVAEIKINDTSKFKSEITGTEENPTVVEFEHELTEGEKYNLIVVRSGKTIQHTVLDKEGNITKDQLLHIKSIEIDEIDVGSLIFEGIYTPIYSQPWHQQQVDAGTPPRVSFKNTTALGHNGTYVLAFESPFYMWLLENLY